MSALVLDAGAFIAVDRNDRLVVAELQVANRAGMDLRTSGVVVAQVWRDGTGSQANLAHLLKSVDVRPVDFAMGRRAGLLLGRSGENDAIDATIVDVAKTGDRIMTSDSEDISRLVEASGQAVIVVPC